MFGTRWLAMLFGFAFFSHQVGGFLGVWLGGVLFERTGSYDAVWWLSILFGVAVGGDQSADRGKAGARRGPLRRRARRIGCNMHGRMRPSPAVPHRRRASWRTPAVIVVCGCLIAMISFGPRSAFGFFLTPMSTAHGWGREVFALSVAMQTLLYGAAQPFSGALADRFGTIRVIIVGALLYAAGMFMMAHATTPGMLYLSSGVLIGFGLSGCSFNLVISSFGKLLPESWRSLAFGAGTAAGSFGQFLFSPLGRGPDR